MPRKKSTTLTNAEHRIMEVVWAKGSATVAEVVEALKGKDAYTTILTLMRILKAKGFLASRTEGRAFVFFPRVDRKTAARKAVPKRQPSTFSKTALRSSHRHHNQTLPLSPPFANFGNHSAAASSKCLRLTTTSSLGAVI